MPILGSGFLLQLFSWFFYMIIGFVVGVVDVLLSFIGNFVNEILSLIVDNPIVTEIYMNLKGLIFPMFLLALGLSIIYNAIINTFEFEGRQYLRGIIVILFGLSVVTPAIGIAKEMTSAISQDVVSAVGGKNKNGLMGLNNLLIKENPDWDDCVNNLNNTLYSGKGNIGATGTEDQENDKMYFDMNDSQYKYIVGVGIVEVDLPMGFMWNWPYKTKAQIVNALNGQDLRANEDTIFDKNDTSIMPTGSTIENRFLYTACPIVEDSNYTRLEDVSVVFKWKMINPLVMFLLMIVFVILAIICVTKLVDYGLEFVQCIILLPVTISASVTGMNQILSNHLKVIGKNMVGIALQIFVVIFSMRLLPEIMDGINPIIERIWGGGNFYWAKPTIEIFIIIAIIGSFCMFIVRGPDSLVDIFGVDSGTRNGGFGSFLTGAITSQLASAGGKAVSGMAKQLNPKTKKDQNGNPLPKNQQTLANRVKDGIKNTAESVGNSILNPEDTMNEIQDKANGMKDNVANTKDKINNQAQKTKEQYQNIGNKIANGIKGSNSSNSQNNPSTSTNNGHSKKTDINAIKTPSNSSNTNVSNTSSPNNTKANTNINTNQINRNENGKSNFDTLIDSDNNK